MEEKKLSYREMAKKYIEYSSVELKKLLLDKKGEEWINAHWKALNKERADIMSKPPKELRERVALIKEERTLGEDTGQRVNELEYSLSKMQKRMTEAAGIGQMVGGRLSEVKTDFT
jgi:hypothetical protein